MLLKRRDVMRPGWHPDPTGRHQYREWDCVVWTEHVSDFGRASIDWGYSGGRRRRRSRARAVASR